MFRYQVVKMTNTEEGYICYGMLAETMINGRWHQTVLISDISCNEQFVSELAAKCSFGQLAPIHLRDVVIDAIS